ncbi:NepR family anti-sigma factor [Sphingomonas arantia]|uniref:NepR family anti-sigma factor n=1 Tax=Sphingomonas arantia TaxID=1460676 RepID=UPI0036D22C12
MAPEAKKQAGTSGKAGKRPVPDAAIGDANVGQALRSAYQRTVNEDVPADLLDLLGKLG